MKRGFTLVLSILARMPFWKENGTLSRQTAVSSVRKIIVVPMSHLSFKNGSKRL